MDPRTNPYAPGAGTIPPELAGRDEIIPNFTQYSVSAPAFVRLALSFQLPHVTE